MLDEKAPDPTSAPQLSTTMTTTPSAPCSSPKLPTTTHLDLESHSSTTPLEPPHPENNQPLTTTSFPTIAETRASYLRKCDIYLLPPVFLGWSLFYLDRGTISLAYINNMQQDLSLTGSRYNLAIMIFFIPYIIVNIPFNLLLRKIGARYWLSGLIFSWGLVTLLTGLVKTYEGLLVTRVFLGLCEGGFLGGVLLWLGFFYGRQELIMRVGIFSSSTPLSAAISGLLATGLGKVISGGYNGWPFIFFVEGGLTVLLGLVAIWIVPNTPQEARFLSPEEKRVALLPEDEGFASVRRDCREVEEGRDLETGPQQQPEQHTQAGKDKFKPQTMKLALTHPLTHLMALSAFFTVSAVYAWNLFMPVLVATMSLYQEREFTQVEKNLMTVPPNVLGFFSTLIITYLAAGGRPCSGLISRVKGISSRVKGISSRAKDQSTTTATSNDGNNGEKTTTTSTVTESEPGTQGLTSLPKKGKVQTGLFLLISALIAAIGYSLLLTGGINCPSLLDSPPSNALLPRQGPPIKLCNTKLQYTGTFFVAAGVYPLLPLGLYWITANAQPHFERAVAVGYVVMVGNFGAFVASWAYVRGEGPGYIKGHSINLAFMICICILALVIIAYMRRENSKRERGDRDGRLVCAEGVEQGVHEIYLGWRHPRFRYVT